MPASSLWCILVWAIWALKLFNEAFGFPTLKETLMLEIWLHLTLEQLNRFLSTNEKHILILSFGHFLSRSIRLHAPSPLCVYFLSFQLPSLVHPSLPPLSLCQLAHVNFAFPYCFSREKGFCIWLNPLPHYNTIKPPLTFHTDHKSIEFRLCNQTLMLSLLFKNPLRLFAFLCAVYSDGPWMALRRCCCGEWTAAAPVCQLLDVPWGGFRRLTDRWRGAPHSWTRCKQGCLCLRWVWKENKKCNWRL